MTTKERLHQLVDELPVSEVATAARVLEALRATADPLASAPEADEPTTAEDRQAIKEGWKLYRQGKGTILPKVVTGAVQPPDGVLARAQGQATKPPVR